MRFVSFSVCCLVVLVGLLGPVGVAWGQSATGPAAVDAESDMVRSEGASASLFAPPADAQMYHIVKGAATLRQQPRATASSMGTLPLRTPVNRLGCTTNWCYVRTENGDTGYVPQTSLSNVWIRISKRSRRLYLYRGSQLVDTFKADFGYNPFNDKIQQGSQQKRDHWRTPSGTFFVVKKNPNSTFHKALVLNYPTADDARRGLRRGLITQAEHDAIVEAEANGTMPPMNTDLGGWIEIHGDGTGAATTWTQGCVAVHNEDIDRLWWWVPVGTPVVIE